MKIKLEAKRHGLIILDIEIFANKTKDWELIVEESLKTVGFNYEGVFALLESASDSVGETRVIDFEGTTYYCTFTES